MHIIWPENISLLAVALGGIPIAIASPFIWRLAKVMTRRLLFPKIIRYKGLIQKPSVGNREILRAAYERQKELDALKDQFIMIASHELRTPLTSVQGYIELLCDHHDMLTPETQIEFLQKARIGCNELSLMVGNLTEANFVHGGVGNIHLHPISLSLTVQHVLEVLNTLIERERRSVIVYVDSDLSVFADDLRLRQVLLNLISNALKYSPPGTRIEVSAVQEQKEVQISVRDYGLGVPPEKQPRLFERFMRLERDVNSSVRGSGLGLYICQQFIKAMRGRIWVESSGVPGEGCVFTFVLQSAFADHVQEVEAVELRVS
jgi:signal transduction histidine kinase